MAGAIAFIETNDFNASTIQANLYNTLPIAGGTIGQSRPVTAIVNADDGRLVAGTYYLTFTAVTPTTSAIVAVNTADSNNPWKTSAKAILLDDNETTSGTGTAHMDIVGGLDLYFSNSASFSTSWTATIIVGGYFVSGVPTKVTSFGALVAGSSSTYRKIGAKNIGDANCENCAVSIYPGIYFKNTTNTPIDRVKVMSKSATQGKYVVTTSNINISGGETDVYVARYSYDYVTNAWVIASANTLKGTFVYDSETEHTTIITGTNVVLSSTITGDSAAAVYMDAISGAQISPDVAGAPGTWVSTNDVVLTETGGSTSGLIRPNNIAYFWLRVMSSISAKAGNMLKFSLRPSGVSVGELIE